MGTSRWTTVVTLTDSGGLAPGFGASRPPAEIDTSTASRNAAAGRKRVLIRVAPPSSLVLVRASEWRQSSSHHSVTRAETPLKAGAALHQAAVRQNGRRKMSLKWLEHARDGGASVAQARRRRSSAAVFRRSGLICGFFVRLARLASRT